MTLTWDEGFWKLGLVNLLAMAGASAYFGDCVLAQIIPDGTLGAESSVVTPTSVNGLPGDVIDGGATRGANLFHSFEQFSIPALGEASFNNALDIQNIVSRVTGLSISNIDGLLRANGAANLFLLNPNGISFGANARLSIGGSFVGSTASSINFADGTSFSATAHPTASLLTVSVPIGLQYGGTAGSILNQSRVTNSSGQVVGLQVQPGKTLSLVGGDLRLDGGILKAPSGRIELGGVAGVGTVGLNVYGNNLRLSYPEGVQLANLSLANGARVDSSGEGGGDIQVQGRRITLTNGSQIMASTLGLEPGGTLGVAATDSVELIGTSANGQFSSGLFADTQGAGDGGNLRIATGRLIVRDGAEVNVSSEGSGYAGNIYVNAGFIQMENQAALTAESATSEGGNIALATQGLFMSRNSQISITAGPSEDSGNLFVNADFMIATENSDFIINLEGEGGRFTIFTQVFFFSPDSDIIVNSGEEFELDNVLDEVDRIVVPPKIVDVTGLIAQSCPREVGPRGSSFIITGRGGLPPNPKQVLSSNAVQVDWVELSSSQENRSSTKPATNSTTESAPTTIVEANGWKINNKGEVFLTAAAPSATLNIPWVPKSDCNAPESNS